MRQGLCPAAYVRFTSRTQCHYIAILPSSRYLIASLALPKIVSALVPMAAILPATTTRRTASNSAYSATSCPASFDHRPYSILFIRHPPDQFEIDHVADDFYLIASLALPKIVSALVPIA